MGIRLSLPSAPATSVKAKVPWRIEAQAGLLLSAIEDTPDITLAELRERLIEERGETFAISTIHDFYRRHGVTFKKRRRMPANRSAMT